MPQETEDRVESKTKTVKKWRKENYSIKEDRKKKYADVKIEDYGKRDADTKIVKDMPRILPILVTSRTLSHPSDQYIIVNN